MEPTQTTSIDGIQTWIIKSLLNLLASGEAYSPCRPGCSQLSLANVPLIANSVKPPESLGQHTQNPVYLGKNHQPNEQIFASQKVF